MDSISNISISSMSSSLSSDRNFFCCFQMYSIRSIYGISLEGLVYIEVEIGTVTENLTWILTMSSRSISSLNVKIFFWIIVYTLRSIYDKNFKCLACTDNEIWTLPKNHKNWDWARVWAQTQIVFVDLRCTPWEVSMV